MILRLGSDGLDPARGRLEDVQRPVLAKPLHLHGQLPRHLVAVVLLEHPPAVRTAATPIVARPAGDRGVALGQRVVRLVPEEPVGVDVRGQPLAQLEEILAEGRGVETGRRKRFVASAPRPAGCPGCWSGTGWAARRRTTCRFPRCRGRRSAPSPCRPATISLMLGRQKSMSNSDRANSTAVQLWSIISWKSRWRAPRSSSRSS